MRRQSVSLPTKHVASDPHEKPDRYLDPREPGLLTRMRAAWMSQSQRARWIKTAAIVFVVFYLFYYLSPSGVELYKGGM
jgi:guanosine-diphosphatase